jgi:hypothetical protein
MPSETIYRPQLERAKRAVRIPDLWRQLGLPGQPKTTCASPFREDRHPSFSISGDGTLWRDHATNEGGDAISFIQRASRCSFVEAARTLISLGGSAQPFPEKPPPPSTKGKPNLPPLSKPSMAELSQLCHGRNWPIFAGLELAHQRGLFSTCWMTDDGQDRAAWLLTDSTGCAAQVRRLDCRPWAWSHAKAWTLKGSKGDWPIGCSAIEKRPLVAFCEGGPDLLAALALAFLRNRHTDIAAVFMAGASPKIASDALTYFDGKRVRIFEHRDPAGEQAGRRWADQLRKAGALVDGWRFDPPNKDLSDLLAQTDPEDLEPSEDVFAGLEAATCQ